MLSLFNLPYNSSTRHTFEHDQDSVMKAVSYVDMGKLCDIPSTVRPIEGIDNTPRGSAILKLNPAVVQRQMNSGHDDEDGKEESAEPTEHVDSGSDNVPCLNEAEEIGHSQNEDENRETGHKDMDEDRNCEPKRLDVNQDLVKKIDVDSSSGIEIRAATKINNRRVYDKDHVCYFCHTLMRNIARHMEIKHANEPEVAKILLMPKHSKARRIAFVNLLRVGDFYHNMEVLGTKQGELILARRPTSRELKANYTYSDYGPCPECLGFLLKRHMWHHLKHGCDLNKNKKIEQETPNQRMPLAENGILQPNLSEEFVSSVLISFGGDEISRVCKEDQLIMKFGAFLFETHANSHTKKIRQLMRQLGRLMLVLRQIDKDCNCLTDAVNPGKFDTILAATKKLCHSWNTAPSRTGNGNQEIPGLGLNLGYALRKCAVIERGQALRCGNLQRNESLQCFLELMDLEWIERMSTFGSAIRMKNAPPSPLVANDSVDKLVPMPKKTNKSSDCLATRNKHTKWSSQEIEAVSEHFKHEMRNQILPGKVQCLSCLEKFPALRRRKWTDIKFFLKNYYTRMRRGVRK